MKIKHYEIEIPSNQPFSNCRLHREQYAKVLTQIVKSYSDGFVLAINNEWGTGKTTFVKMWQQQLINENFQTIYFNAWENDFNNNPLVAIISELKTLTKGKIKIESAFKSVLEKGAVLTKEVAPVLLKSLVKKYLIDTEVITDAIENTTKAATEILEKEIKEYSDKKKTITEFRQELEKFIEKRENSQPLVFIIDELDRCRPNYAVETLEQLKHFFSVNGIIFVLSIDKKHLASSVKGFYGSNEINAEEYLRRFIDLEYSIPKPSNKQFCKYLFDYFSLDDFFYSQERRKINDFRNDAQLLLEMSELLFDKTYVTLRQQEKIFGQTRLVLNSFRYNQYTFSFLLFILIYLKTIQNELYQKIEDNILTIQQLYDEITNVIPIGVRNEYGFNTITTVALLLHFYNNNRESQNRFKLLNHTNDGITTPIKVKLGGHVDSNELARAFNNIEQQSNFSNISLKYLINKINLTESVILS
ncbi:KAP family P-loop NTPase fold protein [Ferruginibacter sp.]